MEVAGSLCERGRLMPTRKAEAGTMKGMKNMKEKGKSGKVKSRKNGPQVFGYVVYPSSPSW
jgi:hypothetical protein